MWLLLNGFRRRQVVSDSTYFETVLHSIPNSLLFDHVKNYCVISTGLWYHPCVFRSPIASSSAVKSSPNNPISHIINKHHDLAPPPPSDRQQATYTLQKELDQAKSKSSSSPVLPPPNAQVCLPFQHLSFAPLLRKTSLIRLNGKSIVKSGGLRLSWVPSGTLSRLYSKWYELMGGLMSPFTDLDLDSYVPHEAT